MKTLMIYAAGLFSIAGAIADWNWFFEGSKAEFFVKLLGRNGARIFYGLLGTAIIVLGFLMGRQA